MSFVDHNLKKIQIIIISKMKIKLAQGTKTVRKNKAAFSKLL